MKCLYCNIDFIPLRKDKKCCSRSCSILNCRSKSNNKEKYNAYKKQWQIKNKEKTRSYNINWRNKNKEKYIDGYNKLNKKNVMNLTNPYIKARLKRQYIISLTKEIIEQKRLTLKIKRKIKQITNETRKVISL